MKEPQISDLKHVTKEMIDALEEWLKNVKSGKWIPGNICPFHNFSNPCNSLCYVLFNNLRDGCPCHNHNFKTATIKAFEIICNRYHKEKC